MQDFKKLEVWKKSHAIALETYAKTASFPQTEMFGVTSQMRRASVSIPSNIAEGSSRGRDPEFAQFLRYSVGSSGELEYLSMLATDLNYLKPPQSRELIVRVLEVRQMLCGLLAAVDTKR